jgi:hypothetical protein
MTLTAFYDEELVEADDNKLTLAIDFRAIDIIEGLTGEPMPTVLAQLFAQPPSISLSGKVLWALLRRHHEETTLDEAAGLMFSDHGNRVGLAMGNLLQRVFNMGEEKPAENPPKRRGRSKTSGSNG